MAAVVSNNAEFFLTDLLRAVSRSFYLTLRVLPKQIRAQIGFAYLLARATDTIADTEIIPIESRIYCLKQLRSRILDLHAGEIELGDLSAAQATQGEKLLLTRLDEILQVVFLMNPEDLKLIQGVIEIISSGQMLDLERFGLATPAAPVALREEADLEDYTWRVAGCVGDFWTRVCLAHLHPKPKATEAELVEWGIRFGKGLQLVNILRDLPADLAKGRCYLPRNQLAAVGLEPLDLRHPQKEKQFRPVYNEWLEKAEMHLQAGWKYVLELPWSWFRVRLACAWPVLIGLKTLELLRTNPVLEPNHRIKISRAQLQGIMWNTLWSYPIPPLWKRQVKISD